MSSNGKSRITEDIAKTIERILASGRKAEIEQGRDGIKITEINRKIVHVSHP